MEKIKIYISDFDSNLTQIDTESAKLYCLPKTHKTGYPLRPIVSLTRFPTYRIAKI